jgi:hypothetical protein
LSDTGDELTGFGTDLDGEFQEFICAFDFFSGEDFGSFELGFEKLINSDGCSIDIKSSLPE